MKKVLVIGYGSIGSRHARIVQDAGHEVAVLSRRKDAPFLSFDALQNALDSFRPDIAIVSNRTVDHKKTIDDLECYHFKGICLVEKPLMHKTADIAPTFPIFVGYNLRFHPIIRQIKELVTDRKLYSAQFYVGQHLPSWRPDSDYRTSYSAFTAQGGGVLRDLSHELDLSLWLTGTWQRVAALGGKMSELQIDSDDMYGILVTTRNCPAVSIQMNYLDLKARREIIINGSGLSIKADLISGSLFLNDKEPATFEIDRDQTYFDQDSALICGEHGSLCPLADGLEIVRLIEACEKAAKENIWICRA